jgi:non-heme chloroperoxidase
MNTITSQDATHICYLDWNSGPPIAFSRGWPLRADDGNAPRRDA